LENPAFHGRLAALTLSIQDDIVLSTGPNDLLDPCEHMHSRVAGLSGLTRTLRDLTPADRASAGRGVATSMR